jgi:hypothetical protein
MLPLDPSDPSNKHLGALERLKSKSLVYKTRHLSQAIVFPSLEVGPPLSNQCVPMRARSTMHFRNRQSSLAESLTRFAR